MATRQRLARVRLLSTAVATSILLGSLALAPPVMAAPDFQILISPTSKLLPRPGSVSFELNLGAIDGFDDPVAISVGDLPAGVTSVLSDDEVVPPAVVTLTLVAAADAEAGSFDLVVTAVGGGITHVATGAVNIDFGLVPKCVGYFDGTVTNLETGAPIPGVDVLGQTSDGNGHWGPLQVELGENNSPISMTFFVQPDGYWQTQASGTAFCDQTTTIDVELLPWHPAAVFGTVVEGTPDENDPSIVIPTGPALEGVNVSTQFYPGPPINTQDFSAPDGSYRIDLAHVNPGNEPVEDVPLSATLDGYWSRDHGSPSPIATFDVEADREVQVPEFGLVRQCTVAVSGSVVYADTGQPAADVLIDAAHEDEFKRTETDEEGRFSLPSVVLAYNNQPTDLGVSALATNFYFGDDETVPLTVCGVAIEVELVLLPRAFGSLEGYVFDEDTDEPVEGVFVGPLTGCGPCTTGPTDADGYYRVDRIPVDIEPATFVMVTHHPEYWQGGDTVEIAAGQTARLDLEILKRKFAHVEGQVVDAITGLPIEGATIGFPVTVTTDANGEYQSGPQDVGHRNASREASFGAGADGYWTQDKTVTLRPDETAQLDYALMPICEGASVRGTVLDAVAHEPIEGASVFTSGGGSVLTGADGSYFIEDIPVGTNNSPIEVQVTASADGYYSQTRSITVFCGGSFTIGFGPEPPTGELEGTVTCNGEPIEGAFVGSEFGKSTSTDATGYYLFEEVPLNADGSDRSWEITVRPEGKADQIKEVTVSARARATLDFSFCGPPDGPQISVTKTSRVDSIEEPGGDVTFDVKVANEGAVAVTLTSLTDDRFGNLDGKGTCDTPQPIAVGGAYECSFSGTVTGNAGAAHANVVTACGDANSLEDCETAEETVQITDALPTLVVTKEASPSVVFQPGGEVTYTLSVTNTSALSDPVELTSLADSVFGDVADTSNPAVITECGVPQTLAPSASYRCSFTAVVSGEAGSDHTNVVTACVTDDEENAKCGTASETVSITQAGQLTPTGTECTDFAGGTAVDQEVLGYKLKGTKINAVTPGVFLYWSAIQAPAAAFGISVHQSALTVQGLPATPPPFNVNESPRLFDAECTRVKGVTLQRTARGQVTLSVNGGVPGEQYYLTVKYDSQSIANTVVSLNPDFEATYAFATHVNGAATAAAVDSLVLRRR